MRRRRPLRSGIVGQVLNKAFGVFPDADSRPSQTSHLVPANTIPQPEPTWWSVRNRGVGVGSCAKGGGAESPHPDRPGAVWPESPETAFEENTMPLASPGCDA